MKIEEVLERMKYIWEQLREKIIELGITIRKILHDAFGQEKISIEIPRCYRKHKKIFHKKEKTFVRFHYTPVIRKNMPYMRRLY